MRLEISRKSKGWMATMETPDGVRTGPVSVDGIDPGVAKNEDGIDPGVAKNEEGIDPGVAKIDRMLGHMLNDR